MFTFIYTGMNKIDHIETAPGVFIPLVIGSFGSNRTKNERNPYPATTHNQQCFSWSHLVAPHLQTQSWMKSSSATSLVLLWKVLLLLMELQTKAMIPSNQMVMVS